MAVVDLDAKRAARSEAENAPHIVKLGGETFELPPRLPLPFMDNLVNMDFGGAMQELFGDSADRFMALRPDMDDLLEIAEQLYSLGDFIAGRPSPSPASSANGGSPPKPTGKPTTAGTSRKTATAKTTSE
jgi:hypothetical protein